MWRQHLTALGGTVNIVNYLHNLQLNESGFCSFHVCLQKEKEQVTLSPGPCTETLSFLAKGLGEGSGRRV